jgi:hypothetical protein
LVKYGDSVISWRAKKQSTVSSSTTESEYRALYDGVQEAISMRSLLVSLGQEVYPIPIYCDNQAAIALSKNPLFQQRTKHIHVKYHFVREAVEDKSVEIHYISTVDNQADGLTKSLPNPRHQKFLQYLKFKSQQFVETEN